MTTIFFPEKHGQLVKDLTNNISHTLPPIFPNLRDLMLFAAMVGKKYDQPGERKGNGGEVEANYFASQNFNKDGVVFLLGLLDLSGPEVLKDGAKECWDLFEQYCAGGMDIIQQWLSVTDDVEEYPKILQDKIIDIAHNSKAKPKIIVKPKKKLSV
jgi:dnd system-associated protein 4